MTKVSIIIPVYNVELYLSRCLDSIINQSYKDIEIFCVNDGSTDNSGRILEQYRKLDSRIKILNQENKGLSAARNIAMEHITGEYVLFVDSDDYVSSWLVEKTLNNALKNSSDVVLFDYMSGNLDYTDSIEFSNNNYVKYENSTFSIESMNADSYKLIPVSTWSKLYKTQFLKENNIKFIENCYYEDFPFWAEVYVNAKRISYQPEPLYYYNTGRNSSIMKQSGEKTFDAIIIYNKVIQTLKSFGYWEKYKIYVNLLLATDALKKFERIAPEFRMKFFNELKVFCENIEPQKYESSEFIDFEKDIMRKFSCLKTADYNVFCSIMGVNDGK